MMDLVATILALAWVVVGAITLIAITITVVGMLVSLFGPVGAMVVLWLLVLSSGGEEREIED